jgi:hypothetical protein
MTNSITPMNKIAARERFLFVVFAILCVFLLFCYVFVYGL